YMQNLIKQVQVFSHNLKYNDWDDRIWISSGSMKAIELNNDNQKYRKHAFVPKEPWRKLDDIELNLLVSERDLGLNDNVAVFNIPESIIYDYMNVNYGFLD